MQPTTILNIALDFHGTTFDHRLAKYLYFWLRRGVQYSNPYIDRAHIIEELTAKGFTDRWYFDTIRDFFNTEWCLSGEISPGLERFLAAAPPNWRFLVLSGMSSNILSIRRIVAYSNLNRISGVYRVPDEKKAEVCQRLGVKLYFDDKPDILPSFAARGIKCIQVSTEGYSSVSPAAINHYDSWISALDDISRIVSLVE